MRARLIIISTLWILFALFLLGVSLWGISTSHAAVDDRVLFLGDSHVALGRWQCPDGPCEKKGISGITARAVFNIIPALVRKEYQTIFIMLGTNDLGGAGRTPEEAIESYRLILDYIQGLYPETQIVVHSLFPPVRDNQIKIDKVNRFNAYLWFESIKRGLVYVDLHEALVNDNGIMNRYYGSAHLNRNGYAMWYSLIEDLLQEECE